MFPTRVTLRAQTAVVALLALLAASVLTTAPGTMVQADTQGAPHLHIDVDPTNGSGPCDPIDTMRSVLPGASLAVALCLEEADLAPINGGITSLTLRVDYSGAGFTADNVTSDGTTDLNSNPNWNETGLGGAGAWDCNQLNSALAAPKASPSPATITCTTTSLADQGISPTAYLALLSFNPAPASGTLDLSWSPGETSILAGFLEPSCGTEFACVGGTISVTGPASPTPPPTNTPSPTATPTPTNTPSPTATQTPTTTPTPTASATRVPGACDGDVNLDGFVDGRDLVEVGRRLHAFAPDPRFDTQVDINGDASVTALDLRFVIQDIRTGECS